MPAINPRSFPGTGGFLPDADTTADAVTSKSSASIAARLDRLLAKRTVWMIVALLSFAFFFELYDMLLSAYIAPVWCVTVYSRRRPQAYSD